MSDKSHRAGSAQVSSHAPQLQASQAASPKRRRFLLALGAGGAGATVVATGSLARAVAPAAVASEAESGAGYRETDHVRDYYATTRI